MYKEIEGDLIVLALEGKFDTIAQGNNCFCVQGAGLAPQFVKAFDTNNPAIYPSEDTKKAGDIRKLGNIEWGNVVLKNGKMLDVVNCYTQYKYGINHIDGDAKPFDYDAFTLCMRKMNFVFSGKHIGLPKIGSHLAGGDWELIKKIIIKEFTNCKVTIVIYKP